MATPADSSDPAAPSAPAVAADAAANAAAEAAPGRRSFLGGLTDVRTASPWRIVAVAFTGSTLINLFFFAIGWQGDDLRSLALGIAIAFSLWLSMAYLNAWLSGRLDWLGRPWRAFATALASNVAVASAVLASVYFTFFVVIGGEPAADWLARQRFGHYFGSVLIGLFITAIYQGAWFVKLWKESIRQSEQLKSANLAAKYEVLNAQVNPHFLFNSLNVLSALVKRDPDAAEAFIQGLSEVYRYVLDVRGEQLVSLTRELHALEAYTHLVLMRFGESRLRIDVAVEPQPGDLVVPLALQMLIENAVKHNGATRRNPLVIEVLREGDALVVRNNKVPLFETVESRGIGLANIRERYGLALGREVVVEDTTEAYVVRLPLSSAVGAGATTGDLSARSAPGPPSPAGVGPARTHSAAS